MGEKRQSKNRDLRRISRVVGLEVPVDEDHDDEDHDDEAH